MGQCIVVTAALDSVEPGHDGWVRIESKGTTVLLSPLTVDDIFAAGIKSRRNAVLQQVPDNPDYDENGQWRNL